MAMMNLPNVFRTPGYSSYELDLSIEDYRYYCDRIKQFYKKYNISEDERYLKYVSLPSTEEKESFINNIITERRNKKIDSLL
jgi:hypothetical protein